MLSLKFLAIGANFLLIGYLFTANYLTLQTVIPMISKQSEVMQNFSLKMGEIHEKLDVLGQNVQESKNWMEEKAEKFKKLNAKIGHICREKYGEKMANQSNSYISQMMVDKLHKIAFCRNAKVATLTWMKHFAYLDPQQKYVKSVYPHVPVSKLFAVRNQLTPEFTSSSMDFNAFLTQSQFFKFSFVRHPFDRIVSAYIEKIENNPQYALPRKIQAQFGNTNFTSFAKFALRQLMTNPYSADNHWKPFNARCGYCFIDYDFIGKLETFTEDAKYVFVKAKLTEVLPLQSAEMSTHAATKPDDINKRSSIGAPESKTLEYFKQLPTQLKSDLYEVFKEDFEMFEYTTEGI